MSVKSIISALGMVVLGLFQAPAQAHEQAIGFSEVRLVLGESGDCAVETCRVEVAHRLVIHDAESTLMSVLGARADLVGNSEAQAKFETYVAERFVLADGETGKPLSLTLLGGEVERGYYWVYQEAPLSEAPAALSITNGVLMDAIPAQTNRVNVLYGDDVETLVFDRNPGPQRFTVD